MKTRGWVFLLVTGVIAAGCLAYSAGKKAGFDSGYYERGDVDCAALRRITQPGGKS